MVGIKITGSSEIMILKFKITGFLRSKSGDHGFFDHGSQKLQFVRSRDHDL